MFHHGHLRCQAAPAHTTLVRQGLAAVAGSLHRRQLAFGMVMCVVVRLERSIVHKFTATLTADERRRFLFFLLRVVGAVLLGIRRVRSLHVVEQPCSAVVLLGCPHVLVLTGVLVAVQDGRRHQAAVLLQHSASRGRIQLEMLAFYQAVAVCGANVLVPATGRGLHQPINTTSSRVEVLHLDPCRIHFVLPYGNGATVL